MADSRAEGAEETAAGEGRIGWNGGGSGTVQPRKRCRRNSCQLAAATSSSAKSDRSSGFRVRGGGYRGAHAAAELGAGISPAGGNRCK
jgi:hypothetical protein